MPNVIPIVASTANLVIPAAVMAAAVGPMKGSANCEEQPPVFGNFRLADYSNSVEAALIMVMEEDLVVAVTARAQTWGRGPSWR